MQSIVVGATQLPLRYFGHKCIERTTFGLKDGQSVGGTDADGSTRPLFISVVLSIVLLSHRKVRERVRVRARARRTKVRRSERAMACRLGLRPPALLPPQQTTNRLSGLV